MGGIAQAKHGQRQMMIWGLVVILFQSILQGFVNSGTNMHDRIGTSVIRDFLGIRSKQISQGNCCKDQFG